MNRIESNTLRVPGAHLYYEVRGSGPVLLMISGGSGRGGDWNGVANLLADQYTVVTYERRGVSRSTLDDSSTEVTMEMHSDDAHRLLTALTTEPAYVFGSSAGAVIGLDLVIGHPEQVRLLIAHEPPVEGLLPDFDQFQADVAEIYRRDGTLAALSKFTAQLGVSYADVEPDVVLPPRNMQSITADANALFAYTFPAVHHYRLDVNALAAIPTRLVLAAGSASRGYPGYRCTAALAERLGKPLVEFPSHHAGYISHPKAFAQKLRDVLADKSDQSIRHQQP